MQRFPIIQGEHKVIGEPDTMISTVLGSCIAACLHDAEAKVGGMNHFLLGEPTEGAMLRQEDLQRYGVHAMEVLINEMMRKGASRSRLRAHLYGGADMCANLGMIGSRNAEFARRFMATEGIEIGHCDLGGNQARRVEFLPYEGKVRSRRAEHAPPVEQPEKIVSHDVELF